MTNRIKLKKYIEILNLEFKFNFENKDNYKNIDLNFDEFKFNKYKEKIKMYQNKINNNEYLIYKFNKFIEKIFQINILYIIKNKNYNYNYNTLITNINKNIIKITN